MHNYFIINNNVCNLASTNGTNNPRAFIKRICFFNHDAYYLLLLIIIILIIIINNNNDVCSHLEFAKINK